MANPKVEIVQETQVIFIQVVAVRTRGVEIVFKVEPTIQVKMTGMMWTLKCLTTVIWCKNKKGGTEEIKDKVLSVNTQSHKDSDCMVVYGIE
jgi:hypothetical protein